MKPRKSYGNAIIHHMEDILMEKRQLRKFSHQVSFGLHYSKTHMICCKDVIDAKEQEASLEDMRCHYKTFKKL